MNTEEREEWTWTKTIPYIQRNLTKNTMQTATPRNTPFYVDWWPAIKDGQTSRISVGYYKIPVKTIFNGWDARRKFWNLPVKGIRVFSRWVWQQIIFTPKLKGTNSKVTKAITVIPAVIILSRVSYLLTNTLKGTGLVSCGPFRFVTP